VFSTNDEFVAVKVEKDGKYTYAVNDRVWDHTCDEAWEPVFDPDGRKILFRTIENGTYYRRVKSISEITG